MEVHLSDEHSASSSGRESLMATFSSSWDATEPIVVLEAQSASSVVHGLTLSSLPLVLTRPPAPDPEKQQQMPCELALEWSAQPLCCRQFKLEIVCSARHVEIFVEGVRRSMLGEDEQGEVYLGTFRGARQSGAVVPAAGAPQYFSISEEFLQRNAKHNILKETQKLRVKFVSLTGDKNALHVQEFKCAYVSLQLYEHPAPAPSTAAVSTPMQMTSVQVPGHTDSSSQAQPHAATAPPNFAAQLAGLSIMNGGGIPVAPTPPAPGAFGGIDTQVLMRGFQQMLEREMETKILKTVDEKLARLSQRLAFSEQRLFQLHQQVKSDGSDVQAALAQIKQQFVDLESHVKQQLSSGAAVDHKTQDKDDDDEE